MPKRFRLSSAVKSALNDTGLPWSVEAGGRHWHVILDGKRVGILPFGAKTRDVGRAEKNLIGQIKRCDV